MPFLARAQSIGIARPEIQISSSASSLAYAPLESYNTALKDAGRRRSCEYAQCSRGWLGPWRSRRRPIFEGNWTCSTQCTVGIVKAAVRRESLLKGNSLDQPHRHRVPIGLVMLAQGWITHPQLKKALEAHRAAGEGRLGDWLMSECGVEQEQITRALGVQWSCPVFDLDGFAPSLTALAIPKMLVREFGILPLRVSASNILRVAFKDRVDASSAFALERMSSLQTRIGLLEPSQFERAKSTLLEAGEVQARSEELKTLNDLPERLTALIETNQPVAARLVRVHQFYWLRLWLENGSRSRHGDLPMSNEDMRDHLFTTEEDRNQSQRLS